MPSVTIPKRSPRAEDAERYVITAGFSLTLPDDPGGFSPRIGTKWKASHPGIVHLLKHGGLGRYILPADAAEDELEQARFLAATVPEPEPVAAPAVAPVQLVRCTVKTTWTPRGGISSVITCHYERQS